MKETLDTSLTHETRYFSVALVLLLTIIGPCARRSSLPPPDGGPTVTTEDQHLQPGDYTRRVSVKGMERAYLLHVPQGVERNQSVPVILAFHGGGGTPESFAQNTDLSAKAGAAGFVVVYPEGFGRSWNAGDCCGPAQRRGIDDVAFVRAVLDDLATVFKLDQQRIFATGFSTGGKFSYRLACEMSDRIAAIATVSAGISIPPAECKPSRAMPVLHFHGLADKYAPFQGGRSVRELAGEQRSVPETIDLWLNRGGCKGDKKVTYQSGAATCVTYSRCRDGADVTLCTVQGMGHQWPGGRTVQGDEMGANTNDISATEMVIKFFRAHPMQPRQQGYLRKALDFIVSIFNKGERA
ncbi:MAG: polyhydroxybutyrate depolymerase [Blastocatellia bacterium]|nr:polyhydroxybutyrate depolymerase [Blastocatellia bacterium]